MVAAPGDGGPHGSLGGGAEAGPLRRLHPQEGGGLGVEPPQVEAQLLAQLHLAQGAGVLEVGLGDLHEGIEGEALLGLHVVELDREPGEALRRCLPQGLQQLVPQLLG